MMRLVPSCLASHSWLYLLAACQMSVQSLGAQLLGCSQVHKVFDLHRSSCASTVPWTEAQTVYAFSQHLKVVRKRTPRGSSVQKTSVVTHASPEGEPASMKSDVTRLLRLSYTIYVYIIASTVGEMGL